ncbi:unnamed protein product [Microthlaspi erraticum]|uniref:Uncharacterized protein n=1 Tax=Microthlaspi erraticum TaxID=1685480 RepID=A0A6D2I0L2_9BRAS|nr:unnamed protein product [Microthlaspi erraticum]
MATNAYDVNQQLDSDSLLPPRKRLLAGLKKQNSNSGNGSSSSPSPPPPPNFASSSSTSYSNGSSSASTDVQTHLDNLLTSQINDDQTRSPDELAQASRATAALAIKIAKAARATANEKAIIASKAVAAAKSALELFASFPAETAKEKSPRMKNKQKKHVPVQLLYSKGAAANDDLARRLHRAIDNSPRVADEVLARRVLRDCGSGSHRSKKQKSVVDYENRAVTSTMYDGHDVAGVVDSDSSNDEGGERRRVNGKLVLKEKTGEESSSLGRRRGRVKLKKLPLSMCGSKDQENGIMMINKSPLMEKNVGGGVSNQPEGGNGGVAQVVRS